MNFVPEAVDGADMAEGRHGPAQAIGLIGRELAATMASRIACSWNSGTPLVFFSSSYNSSAAVIGMGRGEFDQGRIGSPLQIGMHHAALDGPGPHDRHFHHQIVEFLRRSRGSMFIWARLSTWNTPMASAGTAFRKLASSSGTVASVRLRLVAHGRGSDRMPCGCR